VRHN
jgi:hypothetical protein